MTPLDENALVSIHPKHLKLMQFHLAKYLELLFSKYLELLCEQAGEGENVKEISELRYLDNLIDSTLGTHCNESA